VAATVISRDGGAWRLSRGSASSVHSAVSTKHGSRYLNVYFSVTMNV